MAERGEASGFLAGFVVGALIGVASAILFAPRSGEETRAKIRERSIELQHQADELSAEARKRAAGISAQTKEKAASVQAKVKQAVDEGRSVAGERKEELLIGLEETAQTTADEASSPA